MMYTGHDSGLERGFIHYEDFLTTLRELSWAASFAQTPVGIQLRNAQSVRAALGALRRFELHRDLMRRFARKPAPVVTSQFLDWQARHPGRPFFAFLNYFDAHEEYELPDEFRNRFSKSPKRFDVYDGGIAYIDLSVDSLLTELDRRGVLDNTIVVIAADHGEYFGQHRMFGHGNGLHRPVLNVPLMMIWRGRVPAGARNETLVSLRDLS